MEVALQFAEAVASEFFDHTARDGEGDHGLGSDAGGGDDAHVRAFIGCLGGLAGVEGDGGERAAEGGDGLEVTADDEVFAVGDAAFDAAGVVVLAGEFGERLRVERELFVACISNRVVDLGAWGLGCRDAAA